MLLKRNFSISTRTAFLMVLDSGGSIGLIVIHNMLSREIILHKMFAIILFSVSSNYFRQKFLCFEIFTKLLLSVFYKFIIQSCSFHYPFTLYFIYGNQINWYFFLMLLQLAQYCERRIGILELETNKNFDWRKYNNFKDNVSK